ncbi:MAG: ABC transporter permease [Acidimicrobiia bacterium]
MTDASAHATNGAATGSPMGRRWRRFVRHPSAISGSVIVLLVVASAVFAPVFSPHDVDARNIRARFEPPNTTHWLGTDNFGRDTFTRILHGGRVSLRVALGAVGIAVAVGVLLGSLAGFLGGAVDSVIMRVVDVFLAFPPILLALLLVAAVGTGEGSVTVALGLIYWTAYARVVRANIVALREEEFVAASRAMGAHWYRTLFVHVLPNTLAPIIVVASVGLGSAVTAEAALSFLGLGIQPPTPSWGSILNTGLQFLRETPYLSTFPGLAIMVTVLGFNLLGDGLRDVLDPRDV